MLIPDKKNVISQETFDIFSKMLYGAENLKLFKDKGCPFDYESYSGNGLINQQGSRGKPFDALISKTQHDKYVRNFENDDLINFQTFQEDLLGNQKPRRSIQAVTLLTTRKTDDLYSTNITAVEEKCDVIFYLSSECLMKILKLKKILRLQPPKGCLVRCVMMFHVYGETEARERRVNFKC